MRDYDLPDFAEEMDCEDSNAIICLYCGYKNYVGGEDYTKEDEYREYDCSRCERKFDYVTKTSYSFKSVRRETKKTYKFEIQNCINVEVKAESREEARNILVNNTLDYAEEMLGPSCYISDGEEVKK